MTTRTTKTTKSIKRNSKSSNILAKKTAALKKNVKANVKTSRKKITGLVNDILGKTEGALNELVADAKKRLR